MKGCLGFVGSCLFVFGSMFAFFAALRDAWGPLGVSLLATAVGYWLADKAGVFVGLR